MNDDALLQQKTVQLADAILKQDNHAVARLLAPKFFAALAVEGNATLSVGRDQFLANVMAYRMADLTLSDIQVRVMGTVGIVTFYWTTLDYVWHGERGQERRFFNTDVWTRDNGEWLLASHHSSQAVPGPRPKGFPES